MGALISAQLPAAFVPTTVTTAAGAGNSGRRVALFVTGDARHKVAGTC